MDHITATKAAKRGSVSIRPPADHAEVAQINSQTVAICDAKTQRLLLSKRYDVERELREIKPGLLLVRVGNMPCATGSEPIGRTWEADFGHAAMFIDTRGTLIEAVGNDQDKHNPSENSVVKISLEDFFKRGPNLYHVLWPHKKGMPAPDDDGKCAAEFAVRQEKKPYNWSFLRRERDDAFYCSQLCWRAWREVGYALDFEKILSVRKTWVSPFDLAAGRRDCRVLYKLDKQP